MPDKYQSTLTAQEIEEALKKIAKGEAQGTVPFFDFAQGSDYKEQALSLPIGQAVFHIAAQSSGSVEPGWRFVKMVNNRVDWTGEYLIVDEKNRIAMDSHNSEDSEGNYINVEIKNDRIEDPLGSNEEYPYTPASIKITKEKNGRSSFRVKNDLADRDVGYKVGNKYTAKPENEEDWAFLQDEVVVSILKTKTPLKDENTEELAVLPLSNIDYISINDYDDYISCDDVENTNSYISEHQEPEQYCVFEVTDTNESDIQDSFVYELGAYGDYFYAWHPNSNELEFVDSIEGYEDIDTFTIDYDAIANETAIVGAAGHHLRSTGSRFRLYKATTYGQQKPVNLYKWMYDNPKEENVNKLIINTDGTEAGLRFVDPGDTALYYCIGTNRFYHWRPDMMQMVAVGGSIVLGFDENSAYPGNEGNNNRQSIIQLNNYINHVSDELNSLSNHVDLIEERVENLEEKGLYKHIIYFSAGDNYYNIDFINKDSNNYDNITLNQLKDILNYSVEKHYYDDIITHISIGQDMNMKWFNLYYINFQTIEEIDYIYHDEGLLNIIDQTVEKFY